MKSDMKIENFKITGDFIIEGGAKSKFKANSEAIRTLKMIEKENRPATPEEQVILSRYVGWGGLSAAFDSKMNNGLRNIQSSKISLLTKNTMPHVLQFLIPFILPRSLLNQYIRLLKIWVFTVVLFSILLQAQEISW